MNYYGYGGGYGGGYGTFSYRQSWEGAGLCLSSKAPLRSGSRGARVARADSLPLRLLPPLPFPDHSATREGGNSECKLHVPER